MDIFRADGHLTDEALAAFVQDGIVDESASGWGEFVRPALNK